MADRYNNPFQAIDIYVPGEQHPSFIRYSQTGVNASIEQSPFPRMVDLWFTSVCVAARLGLEQVDLGKSKTVKIIDGGIFGSDPWRVHALMLVAVGISGDINVVSEPRRMMGIASGLAVAGLPKIIEMLTDGEAQPIWNLSDAVDSILRKKGRK